MSAREAGRAGYEVAHRSATSTVTGEPNIREQTQRDASTPSDACANARDPKTLCKPIGRTNCRSTARMRKPFVSKARRDLADRKTRDTAVAPTRPARSWPGATAIASSARLLRRRVVDRRRDLRATRHSSSTQTCQRGVCISTRRQTTMSNDRSGNASACASPVTNCTSACCAGRALARHRQHFLRGVDAGDRRAGLRQQQRRAPGAGADVEDRAAGNRAGKLREHVGLVVPQPVRRSVRRNGVSSNRRAVRDRRRRCSCSDRGARSRHVLHGASGVSGASAPQARRVRSR